jgi:Nucleotidyl transferase AbiEii toxin, Type IV TA system
MEDAGARPELTSQPGVLKGDHAHLVQVALPVCATYGLALAGSHAINAHGLVERPSEDVNFATSTDVSIEEIIGELASAYRQEGFGVQVLDTDARTGHLLVSFPVSGTYRVDVLKEPLNHPPELMDFGPVIALPDAVALKMGALHDRGLPRDLLDVYGASARFTGPELVSLCRAALDDEFSLETLRDQLGYAAAFPDEAFARYGCAPQEMADVKSWAQEWSTQIGLDMAEDEPWSDDE